MDNQFFIRDTPALTQISGWAGAWTSQPSSYAVAAASTADVVAAVSFARQHNLRLVVKCGGHSYKGTSSSPDSLLIWMRPMDSVTLHDAFVPQGSYGVAPQPAVTIGAGAIWIDAYHAVTTKAGRYVQGGGCTTVGVAGLVQSGGFGSFSKKFGTAAANLLEAEVVTADGVVRIANAHTNPDLFWGLKGGGGSTLGVVTRLTLRTHTLPEQFGGIFTGIKASSDEAYRALLGKVMAFYTQALFNSHWGEQITVRPDNILKIDMLSQGLDRTSIEATWAPLLDWIRAHPEYTFTDPVTVLSIPGRHLWDLEYIQKHIPGVMVADDRAQTPRHHAVWKSDNDQAGWFIHSYKSLWLPAELLGDDRQDDLADALFSASRHWSIGIHFNKGLAGADQAAIERARETATNPRMLDAFALAIVAGGGSPVYPGMPEAKVDESAADTQSARIASAIAELSRAAPDAGTYVSESDYFQRDWQAAFWGTNYARLLGAKHKHDPQGLFFVHHGAGSEGWSKDGFTRLPDF
jgi:FAD/FMN-containing dehydrogenase